MATFNAEHKEEMGKYFNEGIHKVKIMLVEGGTNDNDKEYIEFTVAGDNGEEGQARVWFTTDKAIKFSFNTIRNIFVHNASKGKEDAAREMVNKVGDTKELVELCNKVLIGQEAWFVVEDSGRTYTDATGAERVSYDRNIYGYEPRPKVKSQDEINVGKVFDDDSVPANL